MHDATRFPSVRSRRAFARAGVVVLLAAALMIAPAAQADEPVRLYAAGSLVAPLRDVVAASKLPAAAVAPRR